MSEYVHFKGSLSEAEDVSIKTDILSFIHSVAGTGKSPNSGNRNNS